MDGVNKRKKILAIDCRMSGYSGIGTYIDNLIPKLIEALPEWSFRLLVSSNNDRLAGLPPDRSDIVKCDAKVYSIKEQFVLPALVRSADALWVPHYISPFLSKIPLIVTVHDIAHIVLPQHRASMLKQLYAKCFLRRARDKAKLIFTVSEFSKKEFCKYIGEPNGRCIICYNAVADSWFAHRCAPKPLSFPYICFVGNMKPHKRPELLGSAFAEIVKTVPHHLVYVGRPAKDACIEQWFRTNHPDTMNRVHFVTHATHEELRAYVQHADALVFPSSYEGFGLPPLEAMASGTMVIASAIPVVKEVCHDVPLYFADGDSQGLQNQLLALSAMPEEEKLKRIEAGKALARSYSWAASAKIIAEHIDTFFDTAP